MNNPHIEFGRRGQAALRAKQDSGMHTGPIPLGYRLNWQVKPHTIEPDPLNSYLVQEIFLLRKQGESVRQIQKAMVERGLRTRRGGIVSVSGIFHILSCPTYKGYVKTRDGQLVRGTYAALCPDHISVDQT